MSRRSSLSNGLRGAGVTNLLTLILVWALFGDSVLEARVSVSASADSHPEETTNKPTLQQRILEVPQGSMVEVRLMNKQKLRGRLGEVTNEGFSLQTAQGNKIETQKIAYADVKSLKQVEGTTGKKIGKGVIYALAGIGALMVVMVVWAMANYND